MHGELDDKIGVAMSINEVGVTEEMFDDIIKGTIILDGGYKVFTADDVRAVLEASYK